MVVKKINHECYEDSEPMYLHNYTDMKAVVVRTFYETGACNQ